MPRFPTLSPLVFRIVFICALVSVSTLEFMQN